QLPRRGTETFKSSKVTTALGFFSKQDCGTPTTSSVANDEALSIALRQVLQSNPCRTASAVGCAFATDRRTTLTTSPEMVSKAPEPNLASSRQRFSLSKAVRCASPVAWKSQF